ncbi:MAG: DmsC/YnfH family molybdoenzyme membrane anchor subunit [Pseudomonadota bacterium]
MHPAPSVIVFTVSSGLGFGMMFWLGLGFGFAPEADVAGPVTGLFALAFAGLGLLASTFHLGNPQRFLKAFTQWRSSWLSREGCVSVALMSLFFLYVAGWAVTGEPSRLLGVVAAALSVVAVFCTAMIYAQLKTVPRWSNPATAPMFLGFSAGGGAIAVGLAATMAGGAASLFLALALLAASAAMWIYRRVALPVTLSDVGSSPETATGLGGLGKVRLLESPHSQPNYLMKEMVFRVGRKHAEKLSLIASVVGVFAPLFLFVLCRDPEGFGLSHMVAAIGLFLALILHIIGALASRWLFFAEAEHAVGLYYGQR